MHADYAHVCTCECALVCYIREYLHNFYNTNITSLYNTSCGIAICYYHTECFPFSSSKSPALDLVHYPSHARVILNKVKKFVDDIILPNEQVRATIRAAL